MPSYRAPSWGTLTLTLLPPSSRPLRHPGRVSPAVPGARRRVPRAEGVANAAIPRAERLSRRGSVPGRPWGSRAGRRKSRRSRGPPPTRSPTAGVDVKVEIGRMGLGLRRVLRALEPVESALYGRDGWKGETVGIGHGPVTTYPARPRLPPHTVPMWVSGRGERPSRVGVGQPGEGPVRRTVGQDSRVHDRSLEFPDGRPDGISLLHGPGLPTAPTRPGIVKEFVTVLARRRRRNPHPDPTFSVTSQRAHHFYTFLGRSGATDRDTDLYPEKGGSPSLFRKKGNINYNKKTLMFTISRPNRRLLQTQRSQRIGVDA